MYHIPVWHPLFVHFPVAFILSAGACSLGWLVLGYKFWRKATLLFLILGFLGGIAAYYTGDDMHAAFRDKPAVHQLVEEHEDMAAATMWFAGAALFVLGGLTLLALKDKNNPDKKPWLDTIWAKLAVAALSLTAAVFVGITGHLGGTMAWGIRNNAPPGASQPYTPGRHTPSPNKGPYEGD